MTGSAQPFRRAIVTGISGQDGHYTALLLRQQGIEVFGLTSSTGGLAAAQAAFADDHGVTVELFDYVVPGAFEALAARVLPQLVFNFAAYATGQGMFDDPFGMARLNGYFVVDILEAIRRVDPTIRFCQASSAEMYGHVNETPQTELTPFRPKSPYGAAKMYAHHMVGIYRAVYGLHCSSAILYNHESPRRGTAFVTRKIARGAAAISLGLENELVLGALETTRDWGYAPEYVDAMYRMIASPFADDYVVATGCLSSIRDVCKFCFDFVGLDYQDYVRIDDRFKRPIETLSVLGDPSRIERTLGWKARTGLQAILHEMVASDVALLNKQG